MTSWTKMLAGLLLGLLLSAAHAASDPASGALSCSDAVGTINLNEINMAATRGDVKFVEMKVLQTPTSPDPTDWRLCSVSQQGNVSCTELLTSAIDVYRNGILLGTGASISPFLPNDYLVKEFPQGSSIVEMLVADENNQVVDYLQFCPNACPAGYWSVPSDCGARLENVGANTKDIGRYPVDGTGSWDVVDDKDGTVGDNNNPAFQGLVGEWRMDETAWTGASGEVVDSVGGFHGLIRTDGGILPVTQPAKVCRGGEFRGYGYSTLQPPWYVVARQYVRVGHSPALAPLAEPGGRISLSGWFKRTGSLGSTLVFKGGADAGERDYRVYLDDWGRLKVDFWNRYGSPSTVTLASGLAKDAWYFFSVTGALDEVKQGKNTIKRLSVTGRIYSEQALLASVSQSFDGFDRASKTYTGDLLFGAMYWGGYSDFFDGLLDEVRLHSKVLSASEADALWQITRPCGGGLDHIRLEHDGSGVTCLTESVTLRACADADCTAELGEDVSVTLGATSGGTFSPNPVTFTGHTTVQLAKTTAGTTTLSVTDSSPAAVNPFRCLHTQTGGASCDIAFAATGIVIDGDAGDVLAETEVTTQLAGKPSNVGYLARQQRIRAVRTDDKSGECVAAVQNKTLPVAFSYGVPVGGQGLADNRMTVTGASSATLTSVGATQSVNLAFDASGTAPFSFVSADAGRYSLAVAMNLPVTDASGNTASGSPVIAAADASNAFVVRPLAVHADAAGNPQAADASGGRFIAAGEDMSMTFTSLAWADGRDADGNGAWDACASPSVPSVGLARVPAWLIGQPAANVVAPSGGGGGLAYPGGDVTLAEGSTAASASAQFSDVGVIRLVEGGLAGFMGESVQVCSPNIGRFHPHHFALVKATITPACHAGGFSYMDQPFGLEYEIEARNKADAKTANYADHAIPAQDFVRGTVERVAENNDQGNLAARLSVSVAAPAWSAGTFHLVDSAVVFLRAAGPDGPFNGLELGVRVTDPDGPVLAGRDMNAATPGDCVAAGNCDAVALGETLVRYGRMTAERVHQFLESQPLVLPLKTEYFTGTAFATNALDSCTALAGPAQVRLDNNQETNQLDGTIAVGAGSTTLGGLGSFASGSLSLDFTAPGTGNSGFVDLAPQLGGMPWLRYDWDGDGAYADEPRGRASWGMYRGNRNVIYMRERWN
ncbi:MAG: DUF6701 domain-containing protein [Chloroflexota bacterium]